MLELRYQELALVYYDYYVALIVFIDESPQIFQQPQNVFIDGEDVAGGQSDFIQTLDVSLVDFVEFFVDFRNLFLFLLLHQSFLGLGEKVLQVEQVQYVRQSLFEIFDVVPHEL